MTSVATMKRDEMAGGWWWRKEDVQMETYTKNGKHRGEPRAFELDLDGSISRDITERMRVEKQVLATSQYARSLIEARRQHGTEISLTFPVSA